ncbi:hypothetical protein OS493_019305 [Desmophyllum pertusum]|uniref:Uncharacterized protein n=1 Tax=Desmophyllum pertusum TaxID=174260 RepID=A0A9X0A1N1_9CNID|nr:hypothetical protein OS493_019305 [Desmophyllum pertusum]
MLKTQKSTTCICPVMSPNMAPLSSCFHSISYYVLKSCVGKPTATIRRAIIPHDKKAKKRKTTVSPSTDSDSDASCDEAAYEKFIEQSADKGKLKSSNSDLNTCHVELRKALEQDGTLDRYGIQHLSLWTDLIQDGKVSGAHEEPDWRKYLNVVHVELLPKRGMGF